MPAGFLHQAGKHGRFHIVVRIHKTHVFTSGHIHSEVPRQRLPSVFTVNDADAVLLFRPMLSKRAGVTSVEPSFTQMISIFRKLWFTRLSRQASTYGATL